MSGRDVIFPQKKTIRRLGRRGGVRCFVLPISGSSLEVGVSNDRAPLQSREGEQSKVVRLQRGSYVPVSPVCEALDGWLTTQTNTPVRIFF